MLCDKNVPIKLKGKMMKAVVRPAMKYGAETWNTTKSKEEKLNGAEMKMLRWSCGITRVDRVRNDHVRGTMKVGRISDKIKETRLRWYGNVMRRDNEYVGKRMLRLEILGKRKRGRPKRRWMDNIKKDMEEKNLREIMAQNRTTWRERIRSSDPI